MSDEKKVTVIDATSLIYSTDVPTKELELERTIGGAKFSQKFTRNNPVSLEQVGLIADVLAKNWSSTDKTYTGEDVIVSMFTGSLDLYVRSKLVPALEARVDGPGKVIDKAAKGLSVALGMTEAEARVTVITQMKAAGKLPADYSA